jgi:hypothetical protein
VILTNDMKGYIIQSIMYENRLKELSEKVGQIIKLGVDDPKMDNNPLGFQPIPFEDIPITFCSYYCEGYRKSYLKKGVIIEVDDPVVYVCPVDTFELIRNGDFIPGYEKFIFDSIEDMLAKYPTSLDFKKDFVEYFVKLNPQKVYPRKEPRDAEIKLWMDYTQDTLWRNRESNNEITFRKPLKAKLIDTFMSEKELREKMKHILD